MQMPQLQEPLVMFISHNVEFTMPVYPRDMERVAKSMPSLAPYAKQIFSMFRPNNQLRLASNWKDKFEFCGQWGGHVSLAWYSHGKWLFASRNGPAVLDGQAGIFDFARFEQYRRRSAPLREVLEELAFPSQIRAMWEQQTGKPFNPPPPVILELWVVANQTPYPLKVLGSFSRLFGEVSPMGISSFLTWEAGRAGLSIMRGGRQVGRVSSRFLYERTGKSEVQGTLLRVSRGAIPFEEAGDVSRGSGIMKGDSQCEHLFDYFVLLLLELV